MQVKLALPYRDAMPTHLRQSPLHLNITLPVAQYLLYPEGAVSMRNLTTFGVLYLDIGCIRSKGMDVVSMPETSIHEYARPVFSKHHVRLPWQARMIKSIAKAISPKKFPNDNLRLGVFALDSRHILASHFLGNSIFYLHKAPQFRHLQVPSHSTCIFSLPQYGQSPDSYS